MLMLRATLITIGLAMGTVAHGAKPDCIHSHPTQALRSGQILQAMVELWWVRKRLPMHLIPDQVAFERQTEQVYAVQYLHHGCAIASLEVPSDLLQRFLLKRLGPEA